MQPVCNERVRIGDAADGNFADGQKTIAKGGDERDTLGHAKVRGFDFIHSATS